MRRMSSNCPFGSEAEISLPALIGRTRNAIVERMEKLLADEGFELNFTQYIVIKQLALCDALSPTELARTIRHDAGAMTRVVDKLTDKGYVRRIPSETDRRAFRIELTEAGRVLWSQIKACADACIETSLAGFSLAERQQLADMLQRMLASLNTQNPD